MPASPSDLFDLLNKLDIETKTHEHEAVFTVEESAKVKHMIPGGHTKNLFVKDKKGSYFLLVAEGTAQIDLKQIHRLIGARGRVSFGRADALMEMLGVEPGSVTAFAPMNDTNNQVKVFIDASLMRYQQINCHPLKNTMTTTISREDLLRFLEAVNHPAEVLQFTQVPLEDNELEASNEQ